MRLAVRTLCLLLALASPLLSQAKAAYGFGLSLAELGRTAFESSEEETDEGYDAQDLVAVKALATTAVEAPAPLSCPTDLLTSPFLFDQPSSVLLTVRLRHGQWRWPTPTAQARHALLQSFLF